MAEDSNARIKLRNFPRIASGIVLSSRLASAIGGLVNKRRSATSSLSAVLLVLVFSGAFAGQAPLLPTLARLDASKLASIEGDVPVRHSRSVSRDVASALAIRIADCRGLLGAAAGRPS